MLLGGPVSLAVSKMTPEVKDAVWREYADSIARYRGPTGYAIAAEMVYGIARNP
jgi:hypothetical protein